MDYFIADLHNGDKGILMYEHRPFSSVQEMEEKLVRNWNNTVTENDTVYLLGDIGKIDILGRLNGKIVIVIGNHDNADEIKDKYKDNKNIIVYDYPIMVGGLWLSHEPITFVPPECPYLNVHGHLHRFNYGLLDRRWESGNRYFCVSVEQIDYTPISIEEIAKRIEYEAV